MRILLSASLIIGLAASTGENLMIAPAHAGAAQTCASLSGGRLLNANESADVVLQPGDQIQIVSGFVGITRITAPAGAVGTFNAPFTFAPTLTGPTTFRVNEETGGLGATAQFRCVVGGAEPEDVGNAGAPTGTLANRTLWQTSQHRDDTQQEGVSGAVHQAFFGQPGASGGATENSLKFVTSFAALSGQQPASISSMNSLVADPLTGTRWNAWVGGRVDLFDGDASMDGGMTTIVTGADYRLTDDLIVGGFVSYNWSDFDFTAINSVQSDAFSIGAYTGYNWRDLVIAELFGAYSWLDYDVRAGAVTGSFNADAIALGLSLYGNVPIYDVFTLQPTLRAKYNAEWHDSYRDSAGTAVASQDFDRLRLSAGGRLYYDGLVVSGGTVRPWVGMEVEYAFTDSNTLNAAGTGSLGDFGYLDTSLGLIATFDQMQFELSADVGGIGSGEYTRYGGHARLSVRF